MLFYGKKILSPIIKISVKKSRFMKSESNSIKLINIKIINIIIMSKKVVLRKFSQLSVLLKHELQWKEVSRRH